MKVLKSAFVVMTGILLGGASAAMAQDSVVARVPFAFVANGVKLPAGGYTISRDTSHPEMMSITHADGRHAVLTLSSPTDINQMTDQSPKLEFRKIGGQYQLARIILGNDTGREIAVTRVSEDVARVAQTPAEHEQR